MADPSAGAEYPIAAVSKLTGVSCHALRVWERRYGFPVPRRSASGHRRYGLDQVLVLRRLSELSHSGRSIRELIAEVRAGRLTADDPVPVGGGKADEVEALIGEFLERMIEGDEAGGVACYDRLHASLGPVDIVTRVIAPALTEAGERWFRGRCAIYQEHYVSGFVRRQLALMIEAARRANVSPARKVLVGTVRGDRHEGGVLIVSLLMELAGWRVISLGVDLPTSEYARAVEVHRPDALALSFVLSRNINKRFQELSKLNGIPVFVGGRSILNYQGLARRYGLTPVPGPVTSAVAQMRLEIETRGGRRQEPSPPFEWNGGV